MDEETLQNLRNNVIKDHRRRLLFVDKKDQEGFQVQANELKKINFYTGRNLYALMIFLVLFGILKLRFVYGLAASAAIYIGLEIYFNYFFLKDRNKIKIRDQEYAIFSSLDAHEEKRSEAIVRIFIPLLLMIVMFSVLFDPQVNDNPIDMNLIKVAIIVLPVYGVQNVIKYFKQSKIIKTMKGPKVKTKK